MFWSGLSCFGASGLTTTSGAASILLAKIDLARLPITGISGATGISGVSAGVSAGASTCGTSGTAGTSSGAGASGTTSAGV